MPEADQKRIILPCRIISVLGHRVADQSKNTGCQPTVSPDSPPQPFYENKASSLKGT